MTANLCDRFEFERELWQQGVRQIAGVDEAGRGPLAGPVVAAATMRVAHLNRTTIWPASERPKVNSRR